MSKNKHATKKYLLLFAVFSAAVFASTLISNSAFAEAATGIVTDAAGTRWEYVVDDKPDGSGKELSIKFYDKNPDATTVVVPSLSALKGLISAAPADLDTYLLVDADAAAQDAAFPSYTRRAATVDTTVLDMASTSKIQIRGVKPIINPNVETELIFGENMVLGDVIGREAKQWVCGTLKKTNNGFSCQNSRQITYTGYENNIAGWDSMTDAEKNEYMPTNEDIGCTYYTSTSNIPNGEYSYPDYCYTNYSSINSINVRTIYYGSAFSGYKLKLTNFEESNFNYIGWETFADSTFAEENTIMTIEGDAFAGADIFKNTNVKKAIIKTDAIGSGIFRDCAQLNEIEFDNAVTRVSDDAFAGSGITAVDFTNTNIKTIGPRAFEYSQLASVDFTGIQRIEYGAFRYTQLTELYLPKSINYLQSDLFYGSTDIKKATVAYDTLTSGTTLPFFVVLDGYVHSRGDRDAVADSIEEIIVLAPYAANEPVSPTHVSYNDYKWHYNNKQEHTDEIIDRTDRFKYGYTQLSKYADDGSAAEDEYAHVDSYKNVLAPIYFLQMHGLKKITIGNGYEFIGSSAFYDFYASDWGDFWYYGYYKGTRTSNARPISEINLPEGLKGVGNNAFDSASWYEGEKINLPESLEYIGLAAFRHNWLWNGNVDLPNLRFLGDYAFATTRVRNVVLHDKLEYFGAKVFTDCINLENITIDFDIFDPASGNPMATLDSSFDRNNAQTYFKAHFGTHCEWMSGYTAEMDAFGFKYDSNPLHWYPYSQKFGTITFTEKAVHEIPIKRYDRTNDVFFGTMNADKIDMSRTPWKVLPQGLFMHAKIDTVVLPQNLEVIPQQAFTAAIIENEIVIPDSVKIIGDRAFENGRFEEKNVPLTKSAKITSLPSSLEIIGREAFEGDINLTADLNAPNLKRIGIRAFMNTGIHDVLLPSGITSLKEGTFAKAPNLHDITIDFDFATAASPDSTDASYEYPQSLMSYVNGDETNARKTVYSDSDSDYMIRLPWPNNDIIVATPTGGPIDTFYTIFNKTANAPENGGQLESGEQFGTLTFGSHATTDLGGTTGYFSGLSFEKVDLGQAGWKKIGNEAYAFNKSNIGTLVLPSGLETVTQGAFFESTIANEFAMPSTVKAVEKVAFQWATGTMTSAFAEGLERIEEAAFYGADMADDLVIPSTVTKLGWAAFNAGGKSVHYDTVTIKPDLTYAETTDGDHDGQLIHQIFYGAGLDKLTVNSSNLPGLNANVGDGYQEFYAMPMKEVTITNLPGISFGAFEDCDQLEKVDMSADNALRAIGENAFLDDEKLHIIKFAPGIKEETVTIGKNAFKGTAFKTMGDSSKEFDLTAAKFDGSEGYAFAGMPKLESVDVPRSFSGATIPRASFYNNTALKEATIDYKITDMKNAAFSNDNKLEKIFIWGNTAIEDKNIEGSYTAPTRAIDDTIGAEFGPTIPEGTDIYAYSVSPTEDYAAFSTRKTFDSTFYPLDEVLYLTSNKPTVLLSDDESDFDKSDLIVYGLRRDGLVVESDEWAQYDGTVYARSAKPLTFERMATVMADNPAFGAVYDTPVPIAELDFGNVDFTTIDFALVPAEDDPAVKIINIIYTDKYTKGKPDTDIDPRKESEPEPTPTPDPEPTPTPTPDPEPEITPEPEKPAVKPETPKTFDEGIGVYVAILIGSVVAGGAALGIKVALNKRQK